MGYVTGTSEKSKSVALVLCLFLGWAGMHRFYVGKIITGVIFFLTFGFFLLGWAFDFISILLGSFRDNVGAPLRR